MISRPHLRIIRVIDSHFTAGAIISRDLDGTRVVEAAPIIRWMVGKSWEELREWASKPGRKIELLSFERFQPSDVE